MHCAQYSCAGHAIRQSPPTTLPTLHTRPESSRARNVVDEWRNSSACGTPFSATGEEALLAIACMDWLKTLQWQPSGRESGLAAVVELVRPYYASLLRAEQSKTWIMRTVHLPYCCRTPGNR